MKPLPRLIVSSSRPQCLRRPVRLRLEELERRATPTAVTVVPQQFSTSQYTAFTLTQSQLLAGDSGSVPLAVSNLTQPAHATLTDNGNGTYTFTPDPSFTGSTTFQYTAGGTARTPLAPSGNASLPVYSASVSGDTAVVGGKDSKVYVFVRSGQIWSQQAVLNASDNDTAFGNSVAISGDTVVVGGLLPAEAYVFVRAAGSWTQQAILTPPGGTGGGFGRSVAVSGDTAVIGAELDSPSGGAAYVYVRSGGAWSQQAKLTPDTPVNSFGHTVSISGDTAVISESAKPGTTPQASGPLPVEADVFVRSGGTWSKQAALTASTVSTIYGSGGHTGPVSISGDTAVIGDPGSEAAFVFVRSGGMWSQQAILTPSVIPYAGFGNIVAVSGDTAVVGALSDSSLYVFSRSGSTWSQWAMIPGTFRPPADRSVSISGDTVVSGEGTIPPGEVSGRAYAVDLGMATATATVQVNPATAQLTVLPAGLPTGSPEFAYPSPTFAATGGAGGGYTFTESGLLPAGLSFDPASARLIGTPTQTGTFPGIVIAAADGQGGSGSRTYTVTVNDYGFITALYRTVLGRDPEPGGGTLAYWQRVLNLVRTDPQALGLPSPADPYLYMAKGFWESLEHRWRQVESYYSIFLGRTLDPNNFYNMAERQYWTNQFYAGAKEADVIRGFLSSPEYLYDHRADASLATVLNTDLLAGAARAAHLADWNTRLAGLDAQRAALQGQSFATPEAYKAQLGALAAYDDEADKAGVLFDVLGSDEYAQRVLDGYYQAFVHRAGTAAEEQALRALRDAAGNPLDLGTIAELMLESPEFRHNAANSGG